MTAYRVNTVAHMAGVSIRTLHHYDRIGLLKPAYRAESGYRYYEEKELLRLQQILFYRELGFPLQEIKELLDDPNFDQIQALKDHAQALMARQTRISQLLQTIQQTIHHLQTGSRMTTPDFLYEGLSPEAGKQRRQEAVDAYGQDAIQQSEQALAQLGKEGFQQLQSDFDQLTRRLFEAKAQPHDSDSVQALIAQHYRLIRQFWGTADQADKQGEAYTGLGQLYVNDLRFTQMDGAEQPAFAAFMQRAMQHFADQL